MVRKMLNVVCYPPKNELTEGYHIVYMVAVHSFVTVCDCVVTVV